MEPIQIHDIHDLSKAIAAHMEGWRYDVDESKNADGELHWAAQLTDGTYAISVSRKGYGADANKLTIRAVLPNRSKAGRYVQIEGTVPAISCSGERSAESIARDIARRLLPELKTAHAAQVERIAGEDSYTDKRAATVAKLLRADIGASQPSGRDDAPVYLDFSDHDRVYGDVKVSGDSCRLEISGLTAEQVIEMVKIVHRT